MACVSILLGLLVAYVIYRVVKLCLSFLKVDSLPSRHVLITGCDSGFGRLLAQTLDAKGVPVFAGCLTTEGARTLKEETSSRLKVISLDVTDEESVDNAYNYIAQQLPDDKGLWGLVNNAGVMPTYCPSEMLTKADFEAVCKVNLFGTISMTLKFLPLIRRSKGRIVNVSSIVSTVSLPGVTNYCVSKAAVKSFTMCLRRELLRSGVNVLSIEPGGFATRVTDNYRLKQLFLQAYKGANEETKAFYGGNISNFVYACFSLPQSCIGKDLTPVTNAMQHGLFAKFPKLSYIVGFDANWFFSPLSLLPEWVGDNILGWPAPYGSTCKQMENDLKSGMYE